MVVEVPGHQVEADRDVMEDRGRVVVEAAAAVRGRLAGSAVITVRATVQAHLLLLTRP